jgi:hypothetical protein
MDFVEKIFGISPDNGDGSFEGLILLTISALIAAAYWVRRRRGGQLRDK